MKRPGTTLILALALTASGYTQAEETAYVTDNLTITLRSGESIGHQVIRGLKSGTRLTITERNEDTGYSRVTLEDGTQGWVLTRLLSNTPGAQQQLLETRSALKKANEKLTQELNQLQAISGNALTLNEENQTLKTNQMRLETEIEALKQQNASLEDSTTRNWFITGTGVMLLGLLIGLIIPGLRWRKKTSWSEL